MVVGSPTRISRAFPVRFTAKPKVLGVLIKLYYASTAFESPNLVKDEGVVFWVPKLAFLARSLSTLQPNQAQSDDSRTLKPLGGRLFGVF